MQKHISLKTKYILMGILALIFLISNVSAENFNRLPFIGSIVGIDNIETYFQSGNNELDAIIPNIEYNEKIDSSLNKEINKFTEKIIASFFKEYNELNHHYTKIDYEVITDTEEWFTLKINVLDIMASSDNYFKYYHLDKKQDKLINLSDLFAYKEYERVIVEDIKKQMIKRMEEDSSLVYWLDDDSENKFDSLADDQNFYFNREGNIVIVFNSFEVGPGSIGPQEFVINSSLYKKYLKSNYIN